MQTNEEESIYIPREIANLPWYGNTAAKRLFVFLLLHAYKEDGKMLAKGQQLVSPIAMERQHRFPKALLCSTLKTLEASGAIKADKFGRSYKVTITDFDMYLKGEGEPCVH